jgi:hypothetical protein
MAAMLVLASTACNKSSPATTSSRPSSSAQLLIVTPTANEVTGGDVTLQLNLIGGVVVNPNVVSGPLRGDQGHIHVSVDGQLVSMAYALTQQLPHLAPGAHSIQAEFVATDHKPFAHRIVAAVLFQVHA